MADYNYLKAVEDDVRQYIEDNKDELFSSVDDMDELEEKLNDDLWTEDSVTGNGSGSYTFSTYQAEEYLMHNLDELAEALEEFGGNTDVLKSGAEACDVTIRCHKLPEAIANVLEEYRDEFEELKNVNEGE